MRAAKILGNSIDLWNVFNGARILIAPLDWGLGHAARCIPIIEQLIALGARPVIGADGGALALLQHQYPSLEAFTIPGYRVHYSEGNGLAWSVLKQLPLILQSIRTERKLTRKILADQRIDAIISDQRFGVRSSSVPSILITHQLFPKVPAATRILQRTNHRFIARFDRCWIMDVADLPGLAGGLSHGEDLPKNARYIGPHSRMRYAPGTDKKWRVMAILSGPEPQRRILENLLYDQLQQIAGEHLIVQGLPDQNRTEQRGSIEVRSHLSTEGLASEIMCSELIVGRSGYTTIMDLFAMGKGALLIPTPGQPEQEYLARLHAGTSRFIFQKQDEIDLKTALDKAGTFDHLPLPGDRGLLDAALKELADMIQQRRPTLSSTTQWTG